jgi:class 3 adenylate cyclase
VLVLNIISRQAPQLLHTLSVVSWQDSTGLWEKLSPQVMEAVLGVHHGTLQQLLDAHRGYESATEGDSFILAFHSPSDALAYTVAAQKALLEAEWPQELLDNDHLAAECTARSL